MSIYDQPNNIQVIEGVRCRVIGGKQLVTYSDIAAYTGQSLLTVRKKASQRGLRTYRIGRVGALEKSDADNLVLGGGE